MSMCQLNEFETISSLRKKMVVSKDGLHIGRIIDVVFMKDFHIHSFIIGGSRWEELKEAIGIIDDIDPIVPADMIESVTEKTINLKIPKSKLKNKLDEGVIPENAFIYSTLKRKKIVDSKNRRIGKIVNLFILPCSEASFIIGETKLEEFSESIKFKENIDLLLPLKYIEKIDHNTINISLPMNKLQIALNNKPLNEEKQNEYLNSLTSKGKAEIQLLERKVISKEFQDFSRFY